MSDPRTVNTRSSQHTELDCAPIRVGVLVVAIFVLSFAAMGLGLIDISNILFVAAPAVLLGGIIADLSPRRDSLTDGQSS